MMLKKKYYDGFTVHDILNKHLDDGHKILELLTAFADADGVDAVEVIRCKDCVHCIPQGEDGDWFYCEVWWKQVRTDLTDYCSRAERKEDVHAD